MTCILIENKNSKILSVNQLTMKYKFENFSFVFENFLLTVQKSKIVKIRDQFQKILNIRKQMKFDAFTFCQLF